MATEIDLTMSHNYVSNWSYVDAVREFFQNALDNETTSPDNKMMFEYDSNSKTLKIGNKTSCLEKHTLLLGSTSKADDKNTIGKHGEGYKIGIAVLLRDGKQVTIYNYQKREIWTTRLKKSRTFNNMTIPCITISKQAVWKKVPSHDLIIEINNISSDEYKEIVNSNLHLREYEKASCKYGEALLDKEEQGNIYVRGLYVCKVEDLYYGYNFEPKYLELDRDRKLIRDFDILNRTSAVWKYLYALGVMVDVVKDMVYNSVKDVEYITWQYVNTDNMGDAEIERKMGNDLVQMFLEKNGENSVPVSSSSDIEEAHKKGVKPVLVSSKVADLIKKSDNEITTVYIDKSLTKRMKTFRDKIMDRLSDEELEEFNSLIDEI